MVRSKLFTLTWIIVFLFINGNSYAVRFHECHTFINKEQNKHRACLNNSFHEAIINSQYTKVTNWLKTRPVTDKSRYSDFLTILMCGYGIEDEGSKPFKTTDRKDSVHKKDEEKGCSGKSALDYALEIPENIKGRKQIISRIKELMLLPSDFKGRCKTQKS